jgi:hypothetical protein
VKRLLALTDDELDRLVAILEAYPVGSLEPEEGDWLLLVKLKAARLP